MKAPQLWGEPEYLKAPRIGGLGAAQSITFRVIHTYIQQRQISLAYYRLSEMPEIITAISENGVQHPLKHLSRQEHQTVQIQVLPEDGNELKQII